MSAHTPGPWRFEAPDEVSVRDAEGGRVAVMGNLRGAHGLAGRRAPNEVIANARLIAAAPELLERLQRLIAALDEHLSPNDYCGYEISKHDTSVVRDAIEAARAAIAKATGSQP